jgi:hypothetical protein
MKALGKLADLEIETVLNDSQGNTLCGRILKSVG